MTRLPFPARPADPDAVLVGRWAADRDEPAFAELVRRHGPLVWAACRRQVATPADAEDAFQAAFLVLARRADALGPGTCLPAWLHRVAVLTARAVRRRGRRRPTVPLPTDVVAPAPDPAAKLDVDDLLNRLPERDRRAVVLCHLLGHTRAEAADRLGIPEGTLSARLSRGLARLRHREMVPGVLAVPLGLTAATVRACGVWGVSAAELSPAASGVATGVLRMWWVKKLTAAAVVIVGLATAGVGVGLAGKPAADPPPKVPAEPIKAEAGFAVPGGQAVKLVVREVRGWVVARYEVPAGVLAWEVVLARATPGAAPPKVSADQKLAGVAVEYGRYSIRDNAGFLRVVRERKAAGVPPWPTAKPADDTAPGTRGSGLHFRPGKEWLWVAAGPFGDPADPDETKADVCLRLTHTGRDGGPAGGGRITAVIGGVNVADHGDTSATDDGELFVARYNLLPPDLQPPGMPPDWKLERATPAGADHPAGKLTLAVEQGWVVARREQPAGVLRWAVTLAQATDPVLPTVGDDPNEVLSVRYGRFFVRDSGHSLRVLRERKTATAPAWPNLAPDEATRPELTRRGRLVQRRGADWDWVQVVPEAAGAARAAEVCVRLHRRVGNPTLGSDAVGPAVSSLAVGRTNCTDDGELFVANYDTPPAGK